VEECPITKFQGGIAKLHEAITGALRAINWLNNLDIPLYQATKLLAQLPLNLG